MQQLLSMRNINKSFFGVQVLKDVNFALHAGEVHILLGENGAGKSTLIKILSGAYDLDSGEIFIENEKIDPHSYTPKAANERGIVTIYQNFHLVPHLSVAENISLSDFTTRHGIITWKDVYKKATEVLDNIHFPIDLKRLDLKLIPYVANEVYIFPKDGGKWSVGRNRLTQGIKWDVSESLQVDVYHIRQTNGSIKDRGLAKDLFNAGGMNVLIRF